MLSSSAPPTIPPAITPQFGNESPKPDKIEFDASQLAALEKRSPKALTPPAGVLIAHPSVAVLHVHTFPAASVYGWSVGQVGGGPDETATLAPVEVVAVTVLGCAAVDAPGAGVDAGCIAAENWPAMIGLVPHNIAVSGAPAGPLFVGVEPMVAAAARIGAITIAGA